MSPRSGQTFAIPPSEFRARWRAVPGTAAKFAAYLSMSRQMVYSKERGDCSISIADVRALERWEWWGRYRVNVDRCIRDWYAAAAAHGMAMQDRQDPPLTPGTKSFEEIVEKGKTVLEILALLYEAPDNQLDRPTLEEGLTLMRDGDLRLPFIDDFLEEFNNGQFILSMKHSIQTIALGPLAPRLDELRNRRAGQRALKKASEAIFAIDGIRASEREEP